MRSKEYWDLAASTKEFSTPLPAGLSALVGPETAILDVGCGYGRILDQLRRAGFQNLIGVDFSEKMIERGRTQHPGLDLRVNQAQRLDFPDDTFDAVLLLAVLTCVVRDQDQLDLLAEVERVLKPGGLICVNDFLLNQDQRNLARYQEHLNKYQTYGVFELPDGGVVRHHDPAWVELSLARFETLSLDRVTFPTMNGHLSKGYHFLGRKTTFFGDQVKNHLD